MNSNEEEKITVRQFLKSRDFLKLGQAINREQWPVAMMTCKRMEQQAELLHMEAMKRQLAGIRMSIMNKNKTQGLNTMALLTAKRVQEINKAKDI